VKEGRIFEHSYQHSRFINIEFNGSFIKINSGGGFDSNGIVHKIKSIEIHGYNLFFGILALQSDSDYPFFKFAHYQLKLCQTFSGKKVFSQLLRNSTPSTCTSRLPG